MIRKKQQTGSAHVMIITVLVVALIAMLGIIFYQNFIAKKPGDSRQTTQPAAVTPSEVTTRVAFNSTIYDLDHPQGWIATTHKTEGSTAGGSTTFIQNAAGTVRVKLLVSEGGIGGACDQNNGLKISSYNVISAVNTKLTGTPVSLVESIFDYTGGGYQYKIGLTQDDGATHAAIGDTFCNVTYAGVASFVQIAADGRTVKQPMIIASIEFPKLPDNSQGPASRDMQTIKNLMLSYDYKAAVKVLESARKE